MMLAFAIRGSRGRSKALRLFRPETGCPACINVPQLPFAVGKKPSMIDLVKDVPQEALEVFLTGVTPGYLRLVGFTQMSR